MVTGNWLEVRKQGLAEHAVGLLEPRKLEAVEPQPAAGLADVHADSADQHSVRGGSEHRGQERSWGGMW
jgi:hypothetical protein